MARDDLFRRSFEAGAAFLDMTRERAEALVKELVKAGDVKKGKAQKVIDEVLERSRRSTEELVQLVRREIGEQVSALGLATKDDITRVESRLDEITGTVAAPDRGPAPTAPAAPAAKTAAKTAKAAKAAAPDAPAAGEAKITGAREAGGEAAAKARAPRKKASPAPDSPSGA